MRIEQATLAAAVGLSSLGSPLATVLAAALFAGLAGWARAAGGIADGHRRSASRGRASNSK